MTPPRLVRELSVFSLTILGTVLGYCAGAHLTDPWHMICSFLGMGLGGACADFCLRGGK